MNGCCVSGNQNTTSNDTAQNGIVNVSFLLLVTQSYDDFCFGKKLVLHNHNAMVPYSFFIKVGSWASKPDNTLVWVKFGLPLRDLPRSRKS